MTADQTRAALVLRAAYDVLVNAVKIAEDAGVSASVNRKLETAWSALLDAVNDAERGQ